jgi:hypothetical protein
MSGVALQGKGNGEVTAILLMLGSMHLALTLAGIALELHFQ